MTTTPHQLRNGNLVQNWNTTSQITANDDWSGVPSIVGYRTGEMTTATGVDAQTVTSDAGFVVHVLANQASTATAGGVLEVETGTSLGGNPTIALQGTNANDYAAIVIYLDTTGTQNARLTATIRDLDSSTDNAAQQVVVQYRIGSTGAWTNLVYFADVTTVSSATQTTPIDITLPDATDNQADVQIRILTTNAAGNDELIGIDDIVVTAEAAGPVVPALSIDNVTAVETNAGTVEYTFTVSLSSPAGAGGVTFDIATADGTAQDDDPATEDADYVAKVLTTQTILQGASTYTFTVVVNGDTAVEPDETFFVNVTNVAGATVADGQGMGTIQNDDTPPTPAASVADAAIVEGQSGVSYLNFTVTLAFAPTGPVTIDYNTVANATATSGTDFLGVSGTLSFAAGETVKTISVPIVGDQVPEANETFTVTLSNPTGATIADGVAIGTVTNDDGNAYFSLASGNFSQDWSNTNLIAQNDDWSGVPHIVGYLGNYTGDSPTGVDARTLTAASTLGEVDVIANQNTTGSSSGGVAEFQIANPTIGIQGSGTADAPSIVLYMDASGRTDIRLQANLRDLDGSTDNAQQQIAVQYRTDPAGDWVNAPGGYFADVTTAGSATQVTALDITLPADANNAPRLEIRILTTNAAGSDEWVGIDDIVVSSAQGAPSYSVADAAAFEGTGAGTTPIVFTVTRAGDASAAGTVGYQVSFAGGGFSAGAGDIASPLSGTVEFAAGETVKTVTLQIAADAIPEADEGFIVTLSAPSSGTVGDGVANGTIVNDDGTPPFVTIGDVRQAEGNDGSSLFTFTVTRTGGTNAFTVDYNTVANGTATAGEDFTATSGTLTFLAGETTKTFTVAVNGDTAAELAETFTVQLSNPTGNAVIADPSATGTIQNDDILLISQVQGSAYYSPVLAQEGLSSFNVASTTTVVIRAVVTAIDNDGKRQGFYLTEESGDWDNSMLTSEGIFVMTRNDDNVGTEVGLVVPAGFAVGDIVTVTAQVMEYQAFDTMPRTMLVNPTGITIQSSGNTLPKLLLDSSVNIPNAIMTLVTPDYTDSVDNEGDTFDAANYALSFWETVEGMLVTLPNLVVADGFIESTAPTIFQVYSTDHADPDQINSRGGYTVAGDPPVSPPDTPDDDEDATIAGGRHLHDGDINPDIIELDFSGFALDPPAGLREQVTMGDKIGTVTGIVDFDFTDRKLFVTEWDSSQFVNTLPVQETTALGNDARALTIATFNVENLDPLDGQAEFDAIANAIATNLNAPDIVMIEEIQDNNGTGTGVTDASQTWLMLVNALNARVPGANYQWVDQPPANNLEGGQTNGNIRVGFLYNTNRVQLGDLAADAPIEERRKWTDRIGDGVADEGDLIQFSDAMVASEINTGDWSSTRKSLLAQFTFNGNTVFAVANHFTAKPGSGDFWQFDQNIAAGQPNNAGFEKRVQQAEDVWHVLNLIQTTLPSAGVIAGGDFNDFYFYRPLEVLTGYAETDGSARIGGTRFANLTLTLAEAERYTYTFDGRSQAIDHIVTSQALAAAATYDIVHLNTGYNSLAAAGTADADPSISDHDPGVASIDYRGFGERLTGTSGSDNLQGFGGDDRLQGGEGADTIDGGEGSDTAIYSEEAPNGVIVNLSNFFVSVPNRPGAFRQVGPNEALDGFDNYETLISIENAITGDKDDRVFGNDGANRFETRGGNDSLSGGAGADVMIGGTGDDSYGVDDAGDVVTELLNEGTDAVFTSLGTYVLAANVENLFAEGSAFLPRDFRGNALDNAIIGASGNDVFRLQDGGDDFVRGMSGRDVFYFGGAFTAGDTVFGGAGADILILQGDYSAGVTLGAGGEANVTEVESLSLFSGSIASYGDVSNATYRYNVTSVDGNVTAGQQLRVNGFGLLAGENLTFDGRAETDGSFLMFAGRGIDNLFGGAGRDVFFFGHDGRFGVGDSVDGGAGFDVVYLRGDYALDFTAIGGGAGTFANVESIGLLSFADTSYSSGGDGAFAYNIVWADAMLAAGGIITINGSRLAAGETMEFDGRLETDGAFRIFAGAGDDVLRGGAGADLIYGGLGADTLQGNGGNDVFRYQSVEESTAAARDSIQGFTLGDIVDLSRIDADPTAEGDQAFTFIGQSAFTGTRGELRYVNEAGNIWKVQADVNGDFEADLEFFLVIDDADPITASDFML
jgi:predicted extracellular nuclease